MPLNIAFVTAVFMYIIALVTMVICTDSKRERQITPVTREQEHADLSISIGTALTVFLVVIFILHGIPVWIQNVTQTGF